MGDRLAEWGWGLVLLVLGGVGTLFTRWISMLHKHEKQLTLLEREITHRTEASTAVVANLGALNTRLDLHQQQSNERMEALRRDLRDDFKMLLDFARKQDERG
jgi:hypothetical protein